MSGFVIPKTVLVPLIGLGLGLSVVFPWAFFIVAFALYGLIYMWMCAKSAREVFSTVFIAFVLKFAIILAFLWSTFPIAQYDIASPFAQLGLILFSYVTSIIIMSLSAVVLVVAWVLRHRYKIAKSWQLVLLVTPAIVLTELAGSFLYSILTLGSGSFIQIYFSFGYSGYAFANFPGLIFFAQYGGVYVLSMLGVFLVSLVYFTRGVMMYVACTLIITTMLGSSYALSLIHANVPDGVVIVNTTLRPQADLEMFAEEKAAVLKDAVLAAKMFTPTYLLLPEDSRYLQLVYAAASSAQSYNLYRFTEPDEMLIIDSARVESDVSDGAVLQGMVYSREVPPVVNFKQYLTPQGEYLPALTKLLLVATGNRGALASPRLGNYQIGPVVEISRPDIPAVLFCFESVRPTAVRALLTQYSERPPFVAHLVSHAWFRDTWLVEHQLDTMLRVQAVANRIPIISAGNIALGKVYLPNGIMYTPEVVAEGEKWRVQVVE